MKLVLLILLTSSIYALDNTIINDRMPEGVIDDGRPVTVTTAGDTSIISILSNASFDKATYKNIVTVEDRGCYILMTADSQAKDNFMSMLKVSSGTLIAEDWKVNNSTVHVIFIDGKDNLIEKFRITFNR